MLDARAAEETTEEMVRSIVGKPGLPWAASAAVACLLVAATVFVPLWKMELVAPQYPRGLVMHAYGYKFTGDDVSPYEDVREINGLNHYIGMKPIKTAAEMQLFIPGVIALLPERSSRRLSHGSGAGCAASSRLASGLCRRSSSPTSSTGCGTTDTP